MKKNTNKLIIFVTVLFITKSIFAENLVPKKYYNNFIVLLTETPLKKNGQKETLAGLVYFAEKNKFFNSNTKLNFSIVGYKSKLTLKQKNFPWKKTSLEETFIGSFLYASGTNMGFINKTYREENRFYTNYVSQILILRRQLTKYIKTGCGIGSRQYFFLKNKTPENFLMPKNHVNIFPRFTLSIGKYIETKDADKIGSGLMLNYWMGYGYRSKWDAWGDKDDLQSGKYAQDFSIYSLSAKIGIKLKKRQNIILRGKYKGGIDNDFLSRPRFGGTIDNAGLDIVHGFTLDNFRVNKFGIANLKYGFNLNTHFRLNLFFDYAHIFSPERTDVIGSGYGFRILVLGMLPVWITHGLGKDLSNDGKTSQALMIMSAVAW